ncbi:MAG TPA: hypothetical protein VFQ38_04435 [Longimicrobiales bacterium]|nr:hypothetical protein [Longimicrobiales bacterium]
MSGGGRAGAMAARLATQARARGIDEAGAGHVARAFELAMSRRGLAEEDPGYLHPGRTALILLEDAAVRDETVLAAGTLVDAANPGLAVPTAEIEHDLGAAEAALVAAVPVPAAADALLEGLLVAEEAVRLLALADRLDLVRHLHLRPSAEWAETHALTRAAYLPVAERTCGLLARRLRWWCDRFAARYLAGRG